MELTVHHNYIITKFRKLLTLFNFKNDNYWSQKLPTLGAYSAF